MLKLITSLKIRGILFKGTTRKISDENRGIFNFLRPLM